MCPAGYDRVNGTKRYSTAVFVAEIVGVEVRMRSEKKIKTFRFIKQNT